MMDFSQLDLPTSRPAGITVRRGEDGVDVVTLDLAPRNLIDEPLIAALGWYVNTHLLGDDKPAGVVLVSEQRDFCAGANIDRLYSERDPAAILAEVAVLHAVFRKLETAGVPVVAGLSGNVLGGGYELALSCHHRIGIEKGLKVGLPEVNLGVIPGGGGTQRLPYVVGLQAALTHIASATPLRGDKALAGGFIDALVEDRDALLAEARGWCLANPKPKQPWDQDKPRWPGGVRPNTPAAAQLMVGAAAFLYKKTAGAYPAAEAALNAVHQGTRIRFDRGLEVEARLFAGLVVGDGAKDMIRTLFYHRTKAERLGVGNDPRARKLTVLGAGMMGGGLAFVAAKAGLQVVCKDISEAGLQTGRAHVDKQLGKLKWLSADARQQIADRITWTLDYEDVRGSDWVIEAVVEKLSVKHQVIAEVEPLLAPDAVFASNTSALPITRLAEASRHPERFIGMHFFSPVEKMPLLEVIQPEACSADTLARTLGLGKLLGKTNIVVNDGYGFFTTRLFAAYILEGLELAAEGHDPAIIEYAAQSAGMVMPPLKVFDEVTLSLGLHALAGRSEILGEDTDSAGMTLLRLLVGQGRTGKSADKGFYDWDNRTLWPGLAALTPDPPAETGLHYCQRRLMCAQAAEVARVLDDGIIRDPKDVEVGAILGLGFAPNTGGPLAWMDRQGLPELVAELRGFAASVGARFAPAPYLVRMAEAGERFWGEEPPR